MTEKNRLRSLGLRRATKTRSTFAIAGNKSAASLATTRVISASGKLSRSAVTAGVVSAVAVADLLQLLYKGSERRALS